MPTIIQVEKDVEGLQLALRELFEESYLIDATGDDAIDDAAARERIQEDMPARTLSPGYYSRSVYLLDLASSIERGATYAPQQLNRQDVRGLEALKRAQSAFEREHPPCPACGTRQPNQFMTQCIQCKTKFAGRGN